jgi:hypothetical protein
MGHDSYRDFKPFSLHKLQVNEKDKLGHKVLEILWLGENYAVYRSEKGVVVQFSDDANEESEQRKRFSDIYPELCELRYLASQMSAERFPGCLKKNREQSSLYDHNIAQALMLVLEKKTECGKQIARQALKMPACNERQHNTIRQFVFGLLRPHHNSGVSPPQERWATGIHPCGSCRRDRVSAIDCNSVASLSTATMPALHYELSDEWSPRRHWSPCRRDPGLVGGYNSRR